jgi:two-component system response regulator MprA
MDRVLIVSPSSTLSGELTAALLREACEARTTWQIAAVMRALYDWQPKLAIVDIDPVAQAHAWTAYQRIREVTDIPILVITSGADSSERIAALKAGADDAVNRTCECAEIAIRARHLVPDPVGNGTHLAYSYGNVTIDPVTRSFSVGGKTVDLTHGESRLLLCLIRNPDRFVSARELAAALWDEPSNGQQKMIKVYVHRLRDKLSARLSGRHYITCRRTIGYRLDAAG